MSSIYQILKNYNDNKHRNDDEFDEEVESIFSECLLDRNGNIYELKGYERPLSIHHTIASYLRPDDEYPLDVLLNEGWITLYGIGHAKSGKKPTKRQIKKLRILFTHLFNIVHYSKNIIWRII